MLSFFFCGRFMQINNHHHGCCRIGPATVRLLAVRFTPWLHRTVNLKVPLTWTLLPTNLPTINNNRVCFEEGNTRTSSSFSFTSPFLRSFPPCFSAAHQGRACGVSIIWWLQQKHSTALLTCVGYSPHEVWIRKVCTGKSSYYSLKTSRWVNYFLGGSTVLLLRCCWKMAASSLWEWVGIGVSFLFYFYGLLLTTTRYSHGSERWLATSISYLLNGQAIHWNEFGSSSL